MFIMDNLKKPLIVNINQNSLDDGPGIRSVIFFKGCPLSCTWCQNPEAQNTHQELIYQPRSCIHCNPCRIQCPTQAFTYNKSNHNLFLDRKRCNLCFDCATQCPADVFKIAGKYYDITQLVEIIKSNKIFYDNTGGGLTLSGGDPLLFPEYVRTLIDEIHALGINICIETAGLFKINEDVKTILENVDLIYFDIKIFDSNLHKKYCGVENSVILDNFKRIIIDFKADLPTSKKALNFKNRFQNHNEPNRKPILIPRIPLIPEITATPANLSQIIQFLKDYNIKLIDLLAYNPLWLNKCETLEIEKKYIRDTWMSKDELAFIRNLFKDFIFDRF
jgi:pyruvate formate lyase activating enzyme